jgi:hypothetical protein
MPIRRLLDDQGFNPEAVKTLVTAFEGARSQLDLSDQQNSLVVELVARLTIDFAKQGVRDPAKLRELVLEAVALPDRDVVSTQ